jgi:hypothetical protein
LTSEYYYVPLASNFATVDSLTKEVGIQSTISTKHPIKGPQTIIALVKLYPNHVLPIIHVVSDSIVSTFQKQKILMKDAQVLQYVVGLPVGINPGGLVIDKSFGKRDC